jgi:rhamnosyltransferase
MPTPVLARSVVLLPTSTKKDITVGIAIPTLNAGASWQACLDAVNRQSLVLQRRVIIDSASTDQTVAVAEAAGFELIPIERQEFNHGGTRHRAAEYLSDCDIVVFLTQDAVLAGTEAIAELVQCFDDPKVAVAYGRQLPHDGATLIEAHSRIFNYGPISHVKDAAATQRMGTKVFFCSNSFAAYRRSVLLALGGFRRDLILGEDMEFAARAIQRGHANFYCAAAAVYHSHDYSIGQTIKRYFDIGVFDYRNPWMREQFGSHRGEGLRFVASELRYLAMQSPLAIPRSLLQTAGKLLGYRLGRLERLFPNRWKRKASMFPAYWR